MYLDPSTYTLNPTQSIQQDYWPDQTQTEIHSHVGLIQNTQFDNQLEHLKNEVDPIIRDLSGSTACKLSI